MLMSAASIACVVVVPLHLFVSWISCMLVASYAEASTLGNKCYSLRSEIIVRDLV
jgi:hypothetical protein